MKILHNAYDRQCSSPYPNAFPYNIVRILKSCRVRHQHPERDRVHHSIRIMDCVQLGHPADDLVVEGKLAPIAQLHDRDRGECLGDRAPVVDRLIIGADVGVAAVPLPVAALGGLALFGGIGGIGGLKRL